ncbi:MAG: GNAT family N-acetyltransferase [Planctomycetes bacterium]|nr:GNAT family N-acetyltransferase [Planctomycetota bacterium]
MTEPASRIERLAFPAGDGDLRELAELLVDAVAAGAAVSFLWPLTQADARAWWERTLAAAPPRAVFLVARDADGIAGTVQLQPAWAPNQPHRAEIAKLLVHRRARGRGLGTLLMDAIEAEARNGGFRLLTLDARRGAAAERLYRKRGWTCVGAIPEYALDPDGVTPHDAVVFYKRLDGRVRDEGAGPWPQRGHVSHR